MFVGRCGFVMIRTPIAAGAFNATPLTTKDVAPVTWRRFATVQAGAASPFSAEALSGARKPTAI
jgi:hypothetical protein